MDFFYRKFFCVFLLCAAASPVLAGNARAYDRQTSLALSRYIMGGIYEKQGDIDQALLEYKKALKADEKNPAIHLSLAACLIKKNQLGPATEEINRAIVLDPEAVEPHAILALLYFSQDKLSEAGKEYEQALQNASKQEPKNVFIFKSLGILYLQKKDFQAAATTFARITAMAPQDHEAHFYLANALDEQKQRDQAIAELKQVLELKPDYHQALNYLGYVYIEENKNFPEAERLIRKAVELDANNGAYIDSLGWLYYKQGKTQDALRELERAAGLLEDPVIFDHLGDAYFKTKAWDKARLSWEKSLKLNPSQEPVKKKLESLVPKSTAK